MPTSDRDPVQAVKAFLRGKPAGASADLAREAIGPELRELRSRLERARTVEARVGVSDELTLLLGAEGAA